jgi:protein associated with RNAse G/E
MIRSDGVHYYCNIASPSISQENSITYIDYDLDIGMSPNNNIRILDEMEYKRHSEQMEYSYELDFIIKKSMYEVISKCKKRISVFGEIINSYYDNYFKNMIEKVTSLIF